MDKIDQKNEIDNIQWWHRIDLGNGIVTPGIDNSAEKLKKLKMPDDLSGLSVLDIGAWDGFFSFEAERRGANRVLATDWFCWGGPGWGTKDGFNFARRILDSNVEDMEIDVLQLSPETVGTFDLVLFLGVLYHMRHPLLALEHVFSVTKDHLILETHVDLMWCDRPAMVFYPGDECSEEPTNWWGPNPLAVEAMLRDVGFKTVEVVSKYSQLFKLGRTLRYYKTPLHHSLQQNRMVFHAWR
jgi:tRNA (mo5U34)-methyltransferase